MRCEGLRGTPRSKPLWFLLLEGKFRIELLRAVRADAMRKFGFGMLGDVVLNLLPVALVIADFFAGGANRQKTTQGFDLFDCLLILNAELFAGRLQLPPVGDVKGHASQKTLAGDVQNGELV